MKICPPIGVVEIERQGFWSPLFDLYGEAENQFGSGCVFAKELGDITGLRVRYFKDKNLTGKSKQKTKKGNGHE